MVQTFEDLKWEQYMEKFQTKHQNAAQKRKAEDVKNNEENENFERSLTEKLNRAGKNKEQFLIHKTKARRKLFHDSDSDGDASPGKLRKSALSTSAYQTRKGTMSVIGGVTIKNDRESVDKLIHNLEAKQARATANRQFKKEDQLRMIKQKPELTSII